MCDWNKGIVADKAQYSGVYADDHNYGEQRHILATLSF